MIIEDLRKEQDGFAARVLARVRWEDCDRPSREVYFEVPADSASGFREDANALLTGCYLPAIRAGERRIRVEGAICPRLRDGLAVAAALVRKWYGGNRQPIPIEPSQGFRPPVPRTPPRAACFLTGGIDSMALLHDNLRDFGREHPSAFQDAIVVFGLTIPGDERNAPAREREARTISVLTDVLRGTGIGLVPVTTNLMAVDPDLEALDLEYISSALVAVAGLFTARWSSVSIASGRDAADLFPQGTHPLLDSSFSTAAIDVRHEGLKSFRLAKLRSIADWPPGFENLIVCMHASGGLLNCGRCEKCVRTMTELLALGGLGRSRTFPFPDVSAEMVENLPPGVGFKHAWAEMLPLLSAAGREDLCTPIRRQLKRTLRLSRWLADDGWKGRIRRIDRALFRGSLLRASRALRSVARGTGTVR